MPLRRQNPFVGIRTRQTTCYHVGDDGDLQRVIDGSYEASNYTILTTGAFSGTSNLDVPHYAASTISFVSATKTIADTGNGLAIFKTGDTIVAKGTASNPQVLTIATGNIAGAIVTNEALTDEVAGAYMTICKRAALSNNAVLLADSPSGKMYARYDSSALLLGDASNGKLNWYDATKCYTIHAAAADLQMVAGGIGVGTLKIVGGAGEIARYFAGEIIVCSGFASAVNNLPGHHVTAIAVNGADLDLTLATGKQTVIAEAASGSRTIKVVCSSVFGYAAAAKQVALGGYIDWVVPTDLEFKALCDIEQPNAVPDTTAFPSWSTADYLWSSSTLPSGTTNAVGVYFSDGHVHYNNKSSFYYGSLARGS